MATLHDVVRSELQKFYLATEPGATNDRAWIFADDLMGRVFRWRRVEDVVDLAGKRDFMPETDPPYRDPIQERVRAAVTLAIQWWWDDDIAEMRADAAGRAVADMIDAWAVQYALEAAKRGPQPRRPPEIEAAYDAERRYDESRRRW
jgi:hypothetical protein